MEEVRSPQLAARMRLLQKLSPLKMQATGADLTADQESDYKNYVLNNSDEIYARKKAYKGVAEMYNDHLAALRESGEQLGPGYVLIGENSAGRLCRELGEANPVYSVRKAAEKKMEAAAQAEEKKAKEAAAANKMKQLAAEAAEKEATATKAKLQAEYDLDYVPEEVFQALDHAQTCTKMSLQREAQTAKALNTEREKVQVCVDENIRLNKRNILLGHQNSELQKKLDTMRNVNYIQENAELKRKEGQMEIEQEDLRYQVGQLMKENKSRDKALATKDAELAALRTKVKESEMREKVAMREKQNSDVQRTMAYQRMEDLAKAAEKGDEAQREVQRLQFRLDVISKTGIDPADL